jgi:hypothetical protein
LIAEAANCDEKVAELTRQRDSARAWAVELENRVEEQDTRIAAARTILDCDPEILRRLTSQPFIGQVKVRTGLADPS